LLDDENLCWEGRPAPRCYTFRNWKHSLCGLILLGFVAVWLYAGFSLAAETGIMIYQLLPFPFLVAGLWLAFGHLLAARFEWDGVWYAISDRRVFVRRGLLRRRWVVLPLAELVWLRHHPYSTELGTLVMRFGAGGELRLMLCCIEQPQHPLELLVAALRANGLTGDDAQMPHRSGDA